MKNLGPKKMVHAMVPSHGPLRVRRFKNVIKRPGAIEKSSKRKAETIGQHVAMIEE